jgi:hypothetical protein
MEFSFRASCARNMKHYTLTLDTHAASIARSASSSSLKRTKASQSFACPREPPHLGSKNSYAFIYATCAGEFIFAGLPWVSPLPTQVTTRLSEGAQKTSSPASWGQAKTLFSVPEHANSPKPGDLAPQPEPMHLELSLAPEKPMALQSTPAAPAFAPLLHTGVQPPSLKISGRPFPSVAGEPSAAMRRTAPCDVAEWVDDPQYAIMSCVWSAQASSAIDHEHSWKTPQLI